MAKEDKDIAKDQNLMNQMNSHMQVFGYTSVVDNIIATCEDNIIKWQQRLKKSKKLRASLGDNWGRN